MSERLTTSIGIEANVPTVLVRGDDEHDVPERLDNFCSLRRKQCPVIDCNVEADVSPISDSGELIVGLLCDSDDGRSLAGCLIVTDDPTDLEERMNVVVNSPLEEFRPHFNPDA